MGAPPKVCSSTPGPLRCESALGGERLGGELGSLRMADRAVSGVILWILPDERPRGFKTTRSTGQEWELWSSGENELGGGRAVIHRTLAEGAKSVL